MICVLVHELNLRPMLRLLRTAGDRLPPIRLVTYQEAFARLSVPEGTLVFTDFDYLSPLEMDAAAALAEAAKGRVRVINHPARARERFALLRHLHAQGLNPVEVTHPGYGERPTRWPVFLRLEDGAWAAEGDLVEGPEAFDAALADLAARGVPLKGRIAVSYETARAPDGFFRKYGAFRIGDEIVPQHILRHGDWVVKSHGTPRDPVFIAEEEAFVRDNPHRDALMTLFEAGGLEFGRVDYTLREGRIVLFEINTNPTFPRFRGGDASREARRATILAGLRRGFEGIDSGRGGHHRIGFVPPRRTVRAIQMRRIGLLGRLVARSRLEFRRRLAPARWRGDG